MVKKTLRIYYEIVFGFAFMHSFFFATYVIFLTRAGLSLFEVNLVNCCFMLSAVFLEIPTGAIADYLGRKFSFVLSCFVFSLSMFVYFLSGTFLMFIIAEMIAALGITLYSGAFEAWMVDSVGWHDPEYDLAHTFKVSMQFNQVGIIFGAVIGAYIGKIDIALPWLFSSIGMFIVGVISALIMKEEYFEKKKFTLSEALTGARDTAKQSVYYSIKNRSVLYIIAVGLLFSFACMGPNMFWQVKFNQELGIRVEYVGWIFAGMMVFFIVGAAISPKLLRLFGKEKGAILGSLAIFVVGMAVAALFDALMPVLVGFFIHEIARGSFRPLKQNYINKRIPKKTRATILSFDSMAGKAGAFIGLLVSGVLAARYSISVSWLATSIILAIGLLVFCFIKNGE